MFVRVFDKKNNKFFKSIVYGILNDGFYGKYLVINPYLSSFILVDHLDKCNKNEFGHYDVLINIIDPTSDEDWTFVDKVRLLKLKQHFKTNKFDFDINSFIGFQDVFDDFETILNLLKVNNVSINNVSFKIREIPDKENWKYINTQEDANNLLSIFCGFHDAYLESFNYSSEYEMGEKRNEDNYYGKRRKLNMIFSSCWYGKVELCFEGVLAINIRPSGDNYSNDIFSACLIVKDESIFWADSDLEEEDLSYEFSFVKAYNLKWRTIFNRKDIEY